MKRVTKTLLGALAVGIAAFVLARKNTKGTSGIGAAKRRIYKEISLAQKAGVDFSKKYDELTAEEIEALKNVSSKTGYTETYYKSLKKAYDAISGIGSTYDVMDADGNVCLTWIEDAAAQAAEKRAIEEKRRVLEEKDAELRKRRNASKRMQKKIERDGLLSVMPGDRQTSLFGVSALSAKDGLEPELLEYVRNNVDARRMSIAFEEIDEMRCPLSMAEPTLYNNIIDLVDEWCTDNAIDPDSIWELYDAEDIFWEL